ncbi:MAG: AAA family ATPase [Solirubrobacteraceae bacterium]
MSTCTTCGQENPPGSTFCNNCGARLPDAAAPGREERRIVTVLFADMAGFTARAERMDPEDVRSILDRYYTRLRREIESFDGIVEKFIGDAVVAFFGAPVAHGDDPERAVRAASAICRGVAEMNEADPLLNLEIRVAVNTGEAIVSLDRVDLHEGMVAGDVVNTAARMQTAAPSGAILVGEATYRATRAVFDYEEVEPLSVKGKRAPVLAWRALGAKTAPGERIPSTAPLLGRANEMATLRRTFDRVLADRRPHLVTVFGEAGLGKTRLAAEFAGDLAEGTARILRGRSLPYGTSTPYGPFSQQVKVFAGIFASDDLTAGQAKLRAALQALPSVQASPEIIPHLELLIGLSTGGEVADRQILLLAARRVVEALAAEEPTILVFEDLHWADAGTLDLLELLASRVRDVPLMLLALARPDLLGTRPAWGGGLPAYTALSLEPLSHQDATELAEQLLERHGDGHQGTRVAETAEGNPLFIEELAAAVSEPSAALGDELPTTVRGLISARLDGLPAEERAVLLDASVVGKVFWHGALAHLRGDGALVSEALDSLEARDLIRHESFSWIEGDRQFSFKHALIRDVAYATLPRARRRELHAGVAKFLEETTAGSGATASALASHWREAGDNEHALDYLLVAAEQAGRGWAKDEAAALYGEALELCQDPVRRRELVRKQAVALTMLQHLRDVRGRPDPREIQPTQ